MDRDPVDPRDQDPYALKPALRWLALAGALLAWTFDGVEQNIYALMSRDALKDITPSIRAEVEEQRALSREIESLRARGLPSGEEEAKAKALRKTIDTEIGGYFGMAMAMWLWGAAAGGIIFGRMGDRRGRVNSLILAVVTYSTFTGLSAFSTHWTHLAACRFLGALGLGGAWPLSVALLVETWPEKRRAVLAGLMGAAANVGFLIAALYSRAMIERGFDWRWIVGMGFFVGLSSLAVLVFVPESPQWKRARERSAPSRLADLFTPRYRRSTIVGSLLSTTALLGVWGSFLWLPAYVDQITEGTDMEGKAKTIVSIWSACGQIVGAFLGGLIAGWLGNRRSWRVLCAASWLSVYVLLSTSNHFEMRMAWMAGGAALFVTSFFGWLPKFLPELYPTRIRATGQGFAYNIGRVLTGFGSLATGFVVSLFDGDYRSGMIAMASVYLLGIFVVSFAPDTGGRLLSDEEDQAPGTDPQGKGEGKSGGGAGAGAAGAAATG